MTSSSTSRVSIVNFDSDHLEAVHKSLHHLLSTPLAESTFAQIADGLPLHNTAYQYVFHPVIAERKSPSPEAIELVRAWRSNFDPDILELDGDVAQAYQSSTPETRDFHLRLIEVIAVSLHTIAVLLFNHTNQRPYKRPPRFRENPPEGDAPLEDSSDDDESDRPPPRIPTYLYHKNYLNYGEYPMGVADVVGYWAEYQLLGGVALFDRGDSETEFRDVFLHPSAGYRVFKLSETQIAQFVTFALHGAENGNLPCPFPMKAERDALRLESHETFAMHIFRNKYERKAPVFSPGRTVHQMRRLDDYPEEMALRDRLMELLKQRDRGSP